MDTSSTFAVFGDSATTMLSALIFLATGTLAFAVMLGMRAREAVRRRAARVNIDDDTPGSGRRSLRYSGVRAAQKLVAYTTKHYSSVDSKDVKMLRQRLIQAGVYNPHGTAYFFLARGAGALGLALAAFFVLPMVGIVTKLSFWLFVMSAACSAIWCRAFISTAASRESASNTRPAFPISWTFWWSATTPA